MVVVQTSCILPIIPTRPSAKLISMRRFSSLNQCCRCWVHINRCNRPTGNWCRQESRHLNGCNRATDNWCRQESTQLKGCNRPSTMDAFAPTDGGAPTQWMQFASGIATKTSTMVVPFGGSALNQEIGSTKAQAQRCLLQQKAILAVMKRQMI